VEKGPLAKCVNVDKTWTLLLWNKSFLYADGFGVILK